MKGFHKFRGGPTQPIEDRLHVTISKELVIGLNRRLYQLLGEPPAVYLHFNEISRVIAVEPIHLPDLPDTFPVKPKTQVGWRINTAPFCRHFHIQVFATHRFINPFVSIDGKLYLDLNDTVIVRQPRKKGGWPFRKKESIVMTVDPEQPIQFNDESV